MSKNIENIDRYLKNVALPEHESHQHRQQLRREVLKEIERRQTMSVKVKSWKYAAIIAVVIGAGALATTIGLKVRKLYFKGREPDGTYIFQTEPETVETEDGHTVTSMRTVGVTVAPDETIDVEQKIKDLEEVDLLRQQDTNRELVGVVETEVNGELQPRTFSFKYTLSDGREIKIGEGDPDTQDLQGSLTKEQEDEVFNLLRADEYVTIGSEIQEVRGRMFNFKRNRFVLSDGTEVIKSFGRLIEDSQSVETTVDIDPEEADQILKDKHEIAELRQQDKRQLIAVDELTANGELDRRVFVYQYQLSDGRTKDLREGDELNTVRNKKLRGDEVNFVLNKKQRQEWVQLKNAGSGEDIGTYEQKVKDILFVFKRQKFTLSDGTELIWSYGMLKDDQ
jgi:hypothetical protein